MTDKRCICQIIGCLMRQPSLLDQVDKYNLTLDDFYELFYKKIFIAIGNLHENGAKSVRPIDVENALSFDASSAQLFKIKNGIKYLEDAYELSDVDNFDAYYNRLKKINLLNDLSESGFSINQFYIEDLTNPLAFEVNQKFEALSISDIVEAYKKTFIKLESKYQKNDVTESSNAFEGIHELLANLATGMEIGEPIQGDIFNQIVSGAVPGKLYIRSGGSGVSKTRQAVGDACYLAFPVRYNNTLHIWEDKGNFQKVLFIATEQSKEEIQRMILSYLTEINESKFKYNMFDEEEKKVIQQALWVLEKYKDNFIITRMPNPTIQLVKTIVRENCILYGCEYVFYDYIFIGPSLINEFKGVMLRNDEILLMFATALKDLAVELNVFIMTSTQLNAKGDDNENIRNEAALAGGRSTINKADVGAIMARPTQQELDFIREHDLTGMEIPNIVTDIYKVRSGEWNQVRIWSYVDLGTLRKHDIILTDANYNKILNYQQYDMQYSSSKEFAEETTESMKYLNG